MKKLFFSLFMAASVCTGGYYLLPTSLVFAATTPTCTVSTNAAQAVLDRLRCAQLQSGNRANANTAVLIIGDVIKAVLGTLGIVFLIITVYAGILWMIAQGDEKKVEHARGMIVTAVIGLVIVLSSYAIAYFVVENVKRVTGA